MDVCRAVHRSLAAKRLHIHGRPAFEHPEVYSNRTRRATLGPTLQEGAQSIPMRAILRTGCAERFPRDRKAKRVTRHV
jgi:hypothetical protein